MNILGYLLTIANLQRMVKVGGHLKETSLHLGTMNELTHELLDIPGFPLEQYGANGMQKHGDLVVYMSKAVQSYIFENRGSPNDEGVIIKLIYGKSDGNTSDMPNTLSYFIHGKEVTEDVEKEVNRSIIEISKNDVKGRKEKRSLLDALKP